MIRGKILIAAAVMLLAAASASAAEVGDVTGVIRCSGIDTYINNYPVNAYNLDGRQLVCAEDLAYYGFNVEWSQEERALYVTPDYSTVEIKGQENVRRRYYYVNRRVYNAVYSDITVYLNGEPVEAYSIDGRMMIKLRELERLGTVEFSEERNYAGAMIDGFPVGEYAPLEVDYDTKPVVVLDPGHGRSSSLMSEEEKINEGYDYYNGGWGEWRHWKSGTASEDCRGDGCNGYGSCWYGIGNGDRDTEPEINLRNALSAKTYLEQMGYEVRLTRSSNDENPSFKKRVSYCYPGNDLNAEPDAACYICIHSNAGGGRGSAYIKAEGSYDQKWIDKAYVQDSNRLGEFINNRITAETSLAEYSGGAIEGLGYMILFNKCPVPTGYMEIGFFDSSDHSIINAEYDTIGLAIAGGVQDYMYN